jgi:hypothetical protein
MPSGAGSNPRIQLLELKQLPVFLLHHQTGFRAFQKASDLCGHQFQIENACIDLDALFQLIL